MFTYAFMKLLERRPKSYDRGMDMFSRGRVRAIKEEVASAVEEGQEVLEIGCGTGELASLVIGRGATVVGLDASPVMLETAAARIAREGLEDDFDLQRFGVDGMDALPDDVFDVVISTLVFSELSDDERRWALEESARTLRPGGTVIIADEVRPLGAVARLLHGLLRAPAVALTYLLPSDVSHPLESMVRELEDAGFVECSERRSDSDSFAIYTALAPALAEPAEATS